MHTLFHIQWKFKYYIQMFSIFRLWNNTKRFEANSNCIESIKNHVNVYSLTKISENIGKGDNVVATFAATEPNETVINTANPSAVNGDDITIGNWSAINTPHIIIIVNNINSISSSDWKIQ